MTPKRPQSLDFPHQNPKPLPLLLSQIRCNPCLNPTTPYRVANTPDKLKVNRELVVSACIAREFPLNAPQTKYSSPNELLMALNCPQQWFPATILESEIVRAPPDQHKSLQTSYQQIEGLWDYSAKCGVSYFLNSYRKHKWVPLLAQVIYRIT